MENKNIEIKGKGIKVHLLSAIFIILGVILMIAAFLEIKKIYDKYDNMNDSYLSGNIKREAVARFQDASDYLTDQARKYAGTGDVKYVLNYFDEKDNLKNREAALEIINSSELLKLDTELLMDAMANSEALVDYELCAMKLVALSNQDNDMPEKLASYPLTEEELALDSNEKLIRAIYLLYGEEYDNYKDMINWDIKNTHILVEEELGERYFENEEELIIAMNFASLFVFLIFILLVLIFIFTTLLVVRPADIFVKEFEKEEKLPEIGGYELRAFARKYNDVYRRDRKNRALLKEQGEIDELTGTLKVNMLDVIKHSLSQSEEPLGIMMVDIDNFRSIKEANGYEAADKLVAKVAGLFTSTFKSSDYTVRTSQDEFELFLPKMNESDEEMLLERIASINESLKDTSDGTLSASVSVGVAFSENGYNDETERKADMALNYVKEHGRANCKVSK